MVSRRSLRRTLVLFTSVLVSGCATMVPKTDITLGVAELTDTPRIQRIAHVKTKVLHEDVKGLARVHRFALVAVDAWSHTPFVSVDPGYKLVKSHATMDTLRKIDFHALALAGIAAERSVGAILHWQAPPFDQVVTSKAVTSLQASAYQGRRLGLDLDAPPSVLAKACRRLGVDAVGSLRSVLYADIGGAVWSKNDLRIVDCKGRVLFHATGKYAHSEGDNKMSAFDHNFKVLETGLVNVMFTRVADDLASPPAAPKGGAQHG